MSTIYKEEKDQYNSMFVSRVNSEIFGGPCYSTVFGKKDIVCNESTYVKRENGVINLINFIKGQKGEGIKEFIFSEEKGYVK